MVKSIQANPAQYGIWALMLSAGALALIFGASGSTAGFEPHGHCYLWEPALLWTFVFSDTFIGLSYLAISLTLGYLVQRARQDIPYNWMLVAFGTFIFACGLTHFMDVWTIWRTDYWISASVRIITAGASIATAIALPPLIPRALRLVEAARLSNQRKLELEQMNMALQREISERREAERLLKEAYEQVEQRIVERTAELSTANARLHQEMQERIGVEKMLQASNAELQNFAYISSHDMQEPLRKIQAFSSRLQEKHASTLNDEGRDYLRRMQGAANRMQRLIENILLYSRITRTGQQLEQVDLNAAMREVLSNLEIQIEQTQGKIEISPLPSVEANRIQVEQVLQNLISNALKYHRPGVPPVVKIRAEANGNSCTLYVEDNGIGFDEKYAERIFEFFQRLHGQNTYEGTGIGLSIVRRIVERHRGSIEVHSTPGQGSTFIVTLPCTQEQAGL